jgi:hypothetical protein
MPYKVKKQGDKYAVYKKDTGKLVGHTAGNKEALRKYLAALHINAKEGIEPIDEESKGLWANIRAKQARGEKPAPKGSEAYNKAVAAAKKINAKEGVIKLADLIKESLEKHIPYMYSQDGFGCHVCKYYIKDFDVHKCSNSNYVNLKGSMTLTDNDGYPINDPSKWCSDWFEPKA